MIKKAKKEIQIMYSTANAFHLQERGGTLQLLREKVTQERELMVNILTPIDNSVKHSEGLQRLKKYPNNIRIQNTSPTSDIKIKTLVVDKEESLVIELKHTNEEKTSATIGRSVYSNSKPLVLSYHSIFESLWTQNEMYEQLKITKEKVEQHDKMQSDFINIAAHELRTPTQAILGYSELILTDPEYKQHFEQAIGPFVVSIERNAERLHKLTEDILNVARIESNRLVLRKERFDLNEKIQNVINDFNSRLSIDEQKKSIQLIFSKREDPLIINADKVKIFEVLSNLINNAIKFVENDGKIIISADVRGSKEKENEISSAISDKQSKQQVVVSVKDNGKGIYPDILAHLFEKFTTKSDIGTGLGLFISKSIIEAHGGRIWAQNNTDGKGATFSFSLSLDDGCS